MLNKGASALDEVNLRPSSLCHNIFQRNIKQSKFIMVQNGRAMVMEASAEFVLAFEMWEGCYWALKAKSV